MLCVVLAAFASIGEALADPIVQWTTGEGGNGHYYEVVEGSFTWQQADDLAAATTYDGLQGYLITTTSLAEVEFMQSLLLATGIVNDGFFVGASDNGVVGDWEWVTGPEAGTPLFFAPHEYPWVYIQPDNFMGNQNWAIAFIGGPGRESEQINSGTLYWDDTWDYTTGGYVVEFGGIAAVAEPTTASLFSAGVLGLLMMAHRRGPGRRAANAQGLGSGHGSSPGQAGSGQDSGIARPLIL
jgi:hypothetical protein